MTERDELERAQAFFVEMGDLDAATHTIVCHGCRSRLTMPARMGVDAIFAKGEAFKAEHDRTCHKEKT